MGPPRSLSGLGTSPKFGGVVVMMWSCQFVTWTPAVPPLVLWEVRGYWPVASIPHLCRYPPYLSPYFPTSLKTNMDTVESAEGSPFAEFIDASLLLHDPPGLQPPVDRLVCSTLV